MFKFDYSCKMLSRLKRVINSQCHVEREKRNRSIFLKALVAGIEEVLFWNSVALSISFVVILHVIFFLCIYKEVGLLQFILSCIATLTCLDALETWLIYKHRTNFLKQIDKSSETNLFMVANEVKLWLRQKCREFVYLREKNPTQAYLLINIFFSIIFAVSYCVNGYLIVYLLSMITCFLQKLNIVVQRCSKKIRLYAETDSELEDLVPENSGANLKQLDFLTEIGHLKNTVEILPNPDSWNSKDVLIDDASESSENSISIETSLSIEKVQILDKNIETSDSSEDEYMPRELQKEQLQKEKLKPTFEETSSSTWGSSAYNTLLNLTGTVSNMMYSVQNLNKRKPTQSRDSSDGFEMIDEHDLL